MKIIAIDNGSTGWYAIMERSGADLLLWEYKHMPVFTSENYTKRKQTLTRIDVLKVVNILTHAEIKFAVLERPMVNPGRFKQGLSAVRAYEATIIALEMEKVPYIVMDSKEWQRFCIPNIRDRDNLKRESLKKAQELYPAFIPDNAKDGDAVCMGYTFLSKMTAV